VLVVSHDRYFISRVANKIVEIRDGELVIYRGDYAYYREKKAEEAAAAEAAQLEATQEAKRKANRDKQKAKTEARKQKAA
jgi:ATP-binding cassette subfamily F protein 3